METKEFKRSSYLTLTPRTSKEAFKSITKKRRDVNLVAEILATHSATGQIFRDMLPFLHPGIQLNDSLRQKARENIGATLQHAVIVAKLLKVKVPGSSKRFKTRTPGAVLVDIERLSGEMYDTYIAAVQGAKVVPMTDEEKAVAQKRWDEAEAKRKAKFDVAPATTKKTVTEKNEKGEEVKKEVEVPKGEYKPGKAPDFTKVAPAALNETLLSTQIWHLLQALYEFAWVLATVGGHVPEGVKPVAEIMAARINSIKGNYPEGFFTPPPPKPVNPNLKPPVKKKAAEATTAPAAAAGAK